MLSTKPVLPNFVKALLFAGMTSLSFGAMAGHHEGAEEKIGDLKDMDVTSSETKSSMVAEEMENKVDSESLKGQLSDDAKAMLDEKIDVAKDMAKDKATTISPE